MSPTWSAMPISPDNDFDGAPLLRGEFVLDEGHGPVVRATLHATAQGIFEAFLNGRSRLRRRPQPWLEQLRVASALPQLRRDLAHSTQVGPWYRARERLVSRTAGLERARCLLRQ